MSLGRVLIVEDDVVAAEDLRRGLVASGYVVVGHAADGRKAIALALVARPDIVLMDVALEGDLDGIAAAKAMTASHDVAIVCVSASPADALVDHAMRTGADGYVVKPFQLPQILTAIKVALYQHKTRRGEASGPDAADRFADALHELQAALADESIWLDHDGVMGSMVMITAREKEVIRGLIAYRRISVVADVLGISVHTARNHLKSVFRKLGIHSQDQLLRYITRRCS